MSDITPRAKRQQIGSRTTRKQARKVLRFAKNLVAAPKAKAITKATGATK